MNSAIFYKFLSRLYDSVCSLYFNRDCTSPRQAVLQLIRAENCENAKVLDVCTGTAANAVCLAEMKEAKIIGIDRSEDMLRIAGEKVRKKGLDNVTLCAMDASKMEFPGNTFDAVLISLVLHEAGAELSKQILLEAKRVLKANGSLIVVEWEQPRHDILKRFLFWFIRTLEPKGFSEFLKMDMNRYFEQFGLYIKEEIHCDYSRVMRIIKNND